MDVGKEAFAQRNPGSTFYVSFSCAEFSPHARGEETPRRKGSAKSSSTTSITFENFFQPPFPPWNTEHERKQLMAF